MIDQVRKRIILNKIEQLRDMKQDGTSEELEVALELCDEIEGVLRELPRYEHETLIYEVAGEYRIVFQGKPGWLPQAMERLRKGTAHRYKGILPND